MVRAQRDRTLPVPRARRRSAPVTMASTTSFTVTPHARFTAMTSAIGSESHANARRRPTGRVNGNRARLGQPAVAQRADGPGCQARVRHEAPRVEQRATDVDSEVRLSTGAFGERCRGQMKSTGDRFRRPVVSRLRGRLWGRARAARSRPRAGRGHRPSRDAHGRRSPPRPHRNRRRNGCPTAGGRDPSVR